MTPEQLDQMAWDEFKEGVYDKYIPRSYGKAKAFEFYNLKQGRMDVTEYDRAFDNVSWYALDQVDTDEKMAERFRAGLRHEIRMALASHGALSYPESLGRALDIEAAMPKEMTVVPAAPAPNTPQQHNSRDKRIWDGDRAPQDNKRHQSAPRPSQHGRKQISPYQRGDSRSRVPFCAKCSQNHFGECKTKTYKCYNCGGDRHISGEWPSKNAGMGTRQNPQGQRRS